jgi:hypothetical protein
LLPRGKTGSPPLAATVRAKEFKEGIVNAKFFAVVSLLLYFLFASGFHTGHQRPRCPTPNYRQSGKPDRNEKKQNDTRERRQPTACTSRSFRNLELWVEIALYGSAAV